MKGGRDPEAGSEVDEAPGASQDEGLLGRVHARFGAGSVLAVWAPSRESLRKLRGAGPRLWVCLLACAVAVAIFLAINKFQVATTTPLSYWALIAIPLIALIWMQVHTLNANEATARAGDVYVATNAGLATLRTSATAPSCLCWYSFCCCCCRPSGSRADGAVELVAWAQVRSLHVESTGCCSGSAVPTLRIVATTGHFSGSGDDRSFYHDQVVWLVDNPDEVAAFLQRCKGRLEVLSVAAALHAVAPAIQVMNAAPLAQATLRVLCSLRGDASRTSVLQVTNDMSEAEVARLACDALGIVQAHPSRGTATVLLCKNGKQFRLASAAVLAPDDEIVLAWE